MKTKHIDTDLSLQPCSSVAPLTALAQLDQLAGMFDSSLEPPHQVEPLPVLSVGRLLQLHTQSPGPLGTHKGYIQEPEIIKLSGLSA